jgi:beta-galactosidase GanA
MRCRAVLILSLLIISLGAPAFSAAPPHLVRQGSATQLIVDDKPFLMLGGELGNSTASDPAYLDEAWPRLQTIGLNTLFMPVEWDQIEPRQGQFDFSVIDADIAQARAHHVRLVLLWFGAWKNSMSTYAPPWVKRDWRTYSRARDEKGTAQDILSPFDPDTLKADSAAFSALMTHLKATDSGHTVIMMQVENEIGMLSCARDHSPAADKAFGEPVPPPLLAYMRAHKADLRPELTALWAAQGSPVSGTWSEVFGAGAAGQEVFQAWYFARYANAVALAGKAAYDLPMYVNVALNRPGKAPGEYPSAGPLPHLFDIWKAGAPAIDIIGIDHYFPDFIAWADQFKRPDNPFLTPESNQAGFHQAPGNAWYAFGQLDAMSFSPFSIETLPKDDPIIATYRALNDLAPLILQSQGKNLMRGFRAPVAYDGTVDETPQIFELGGVRFTATMVYPWVAKDKQDVAEHGGMIVKTADEDFIVAGTGITLRFSDPANQDQIGIEQVVEGRYQDGKFIIGRWLNGDEIHQGRQLQIPPGQTWILRLRLYHYR